MRTLCITWKNKRSGFTRRARWYAASTEELGTDIRLCLEDESGKMNHYPSNESEAQMMWDLFKRGEIDFRGEQPKRQ